jgi:hypothetical protein
MQSPSRPFISDLRCLCAVASSLLLGALLVLLVPATSGARVMSFGSSLSGPATLNTSEDLSYGGSFVAVPPAPDAPNGLYHVLHYGTDSALWNVGQLESGDASAPATGQATKVSLEGCAVAAPGGPAPLTQIHFQDISPLPGGGATVNLTSQPFDIPVCGQNGTSGSTVTTYEPINLCVSAGDYVTFNDEGGFVPGSYPFGVPYKVMGSAVGATMDSFLKSEATGNGAVLSPSDLAPDEGFAVNHGRELLLQVTLGTGPDATHICAGGSGGVPHLPPISVKPQTDGVNHSRYVAVAVYCRLSPECKGIATLTLPDGHTTVGRTGFSLQALHTAHIPIQVSSSLIGMIRHNHGVSTTLTAVVGGTTVNQTIAVKIF